MATVLIRTTIVRFVARHSLPKYASISLTVANGVGSLGALMAWAVVVGPFVRSGGEAYRFLLGTVMLIGLGIAFIAARELYGMQDPRRTSL